MRIKALPFLLLLLLSAPVSFAQSGSIDADIEIQDAPASCTFNTTGGDLDFGGLYKPTGSANNDVVMNAETGTLAVQGSGNGSAFGSSQVGAFSLGGTNTASFTVGVTFPANLAAGSSTLAYSGAWAQSSTQGSGFTLVSGATYNGTDSSSGPFTHYFRVGGTVGGIAAGTESGVYTGNVAITGSCN